MKIILILMIIKTDGVLCQPYYHKDYWSSKTREWYGYSWEVFTIYHECGNRTIEENNFLTGIDMSESDLTERNCKKISY